MGEYTFEVHNVKTLEYSLKKFIGNQICRSRAKPQPYYYPQCHCTEEKKYLSDSVDSKSVFVSHGFANNNIHSSPHIKPPGPTRDCLHLSTEVDDPLSLTGGGFPLRHSFSTGDLLESSSLSSYPPRQVSHKTHVRLFVSLSGEGPCIVEDDQHQSNSTQCACTSGSVLLAHPKADSNVGRVLPTPTSSSSSGTSTSSNNPKNIKQQTRVLPAYSNSQPPSEMLDLSVTPKQATPDDVPQIAADFSNVGYLPRSSPLVSKNSYLKFKSKLKCDHLNNSR